MSPEFFRGYVALTAVTINRAEMAGALKAAAEKLHAQGVITREELDLPEATTAVDLRATAIPVLENVVWAAFVEFLEDCDGQLYDLFNQNMRADDTIEAATAAYREDLRLKPYLEAAAAFVEQAKAVGYGGIQYRGTLTGDPHFELLKGWIGYPPTQDLNKPDCLRRIAEICADGAELPPIPIPVIYI